MSSVRVEEIYARLGRGPISTAQHRPLHGDLIDLLARGRQPGEYFFPFTNLEGRSQHDYKVGGFTFSMEQQDDGPWRRVTS